MASRRGDSLGGVCGDDLFTLPYLALQPLGAGYLLETLTNGAIPFAVGAIVLTVAIVVYVVGGGMNAVAKTDVLQGVLMFALMLLAFAAVAQGVGGRHSGEPNAAARAAPSCSVRQDWCQYFFTPRMLVQLFAALAVVSADVPADADAFFCSRG